MILLSRPLVKSLPGNSRFFPEKIPDILLGETAFSDGGGMLRTERDNGIAKPGNQSPHVIIAQGCHCTGDSRQNFCCGERIMVVNIMRVFHSHHADRTHPGNKPPLDVEGFPGIVLLIFSNAKYVFARLTLRGHIGLTR